MKEEQNNSNPFVIRAYTKKDLRLKFGMPEATFRRWLRAIPELSTGSKNWLTPLQVEAIIRTYGVPGEKRFKTSNF